MITQALGQTAIDHFALVFGQHNTRTLIDQLADSGKIFIGKDQVTFQLTRSGPLSLIRSELWCPGQNVSHSSSTGVLPPSGRCAVGNGSCDTTGWSLSAVNWPARSRPCFDNVSVPAPRRRKTRTA